MTFRFKCSAWNEREEKTEVGYFIRDFSGADDYTPSDIVTICVEDCLNWCTQNAYEFKTFDFLERGKVSRGTLQK